MNLKTLATVFAVILLSALIPGLSAPVAGQATNATDPPVEQARKNIQVLKGLPESQLFLEMNFVGDSLGVHCDYCHVKGEKNPQTGANTWLWEKDDKRTKLTARDMMRMVLELNRTKFNREAVVTCYTCHRGSTRVERMAPLPPRDFTKEALERTTTVLPSPQEVVTKYLSAVGATQKDALSKAIVMKGVVERSTGSFPFEVVSKQSKKLLVRQTTPSGVITQGTNGATAWTQTAKSTTPFAGDSLKQISQLAVLYSAVKLPDSVSAASINVVKVDNRDAYVLTIEEDSTHLTQWAFDVETGLLVRFVTVTNTMLGPLNVQWDFGDYKDIGGLKVPFMIRTSNVAAFDTATRKFNDVKITPAIDDNIFEMPRPAAP